jgi:tmRNA-binding protein
VEQTALKQAISQGAFDLQAAETLFVNSHVLIVQSSDWWLELYIQIYDFVSNVVEDKVARRKLLLSEVRLIWTWDWTLQH